MVAAARKIGQREVCCCCINGPRFEIEICEPQEHVRIHNIIVLVVQIFQVG